MREKEREEGEGKRQRGSERGWEGVSGIERGLGECEREWKGRLEIVIRSEREGGREREGVRQKGSEKERERG